MIDFANHAFLLFKCQGVSAVCQDFVRDVYAGKRLPNATAVLGPLKGVLLWLWPSCQVGTGYESALLYASVRK